MLSHPYDKRGCTNGEVDVLGLQTLGALCAVGAARLAEKQSYLQVKMNMRLCQVIFDAEEMTLNDQSDGTQGTADKTASGDDGFCFLQGGGRGRGGCVCWGGGGWFRRAKKMCCTTSTKQESAAGKGSSGLCNW